ncbi:MAG: entericidin A/B family lipoprotein [Pseudomonadota bacterium]
MQRGSPASIVTLCATGRRSDEGALAMMRTVLFVLAAMMAVSACNTVQGVGRDIEALGEALEDAVSN